MSEQRPVKANERPQHGPPRGGGHGPGPVGGTGEKAADFWGSTRRLLSAIRPERAGMLTAVILGVLSTLMIAVGPRILGRATDYLLAGYIAQQLPAGLTKEQAIAAAEAAGETNFADMLRNLDFTPGQAFDFRTIGIILTIVMVLYVLAGLMQYLQGWVLNGAVQRTIYRMRQAVSAKIDRLPLSYFDKQPRGELLSRVTNDIDNVSQTLQQTMSQLLNALLMVIGVLVMMFWISPTLALVALVSVPIGMVVVGVIGKRAQKLFAQNWKSTGELNAHIEEAFTGHSLVKVFGRHREVQAEFDRRNEELFQAGFGAQFISGLIMPIMFLVGNINYVIIAVIGGLRVATGQMNIGDVQAFIQYSRQFTQPLTQVASMANLLQSGVASAERVFELLDAEQQVPDPVDASPHQPLLFIGTGRCSATARGAHLALGRRDDPGRWGRRTRPCAGQRRRRPPCRCRLRSRAGSTSRRARSRWRATPRPPPRRRSPRRRHRGTGPAGTPVRTPGRPRPCPPRPGPAAWPCDTGPTPSPGAAGRATSCGRGCCRRCC